MQMENKLSQEIVADKLLWGLWRSIDDSYKERYYADIWQHFENAIRAASSTDSLKRFLSNIRNRIPISNIQKQYHKDIMQIIESGRDDVVLDWLRSETTYLVMKCSLMNQERKETLKETNK